MIAAVHPGTQDEIVPMCQFYFIYLFGTHCVLHNYPSVLACVQERCLLRREENADVFLYYGQIKCLLPLRQSAFVRLCVSLYACEDIISMWETFAPDLL